MQPAHKSGTDARTEELPQHNSLRCLGRFCFEPEDSPQHKFFSPEVHRAIALLFLHGSLVSDRGLPSPRPESERVCRLQQFIRKTSAFQGDLERIMRITNLFLGASVLLLEMAPCLGKSAGE